MNVETRIKIEKTVVRLIVESVLSFCYCVSIHNGEYFSISHSRNKGEIMQNVMTTDTDVLVVHSEFGVNLGKIYLVYGNDGWDVVTDHTDNEIINLVLEDANKYAMKMEEKYS